MCLRKRELRKMKPKVKKKITPNSKNIRTKLLRNKKSTLPMDNKKLPTLPNKKASMKWTKNTTTYLRSIVFTCMGLKLVGVSTL